MDNPSSFQTEQFCLPSLSPPPKSPFFPGDICQCLKTCLIPMTGDVTGMHGVGAGDAVKHLTMYRAAPTAKNYLVRSVTSAKTEKPCTQQTQEHMAGQV